MSGLEADWGEVKVYKQIPFKIMNVTVAFNYSFRSSNASYYLCETYPEYIIKRLNFHKPGFIDNVGKIRELIAAYRKAEDLINIGAYQQGSNPTIDRAVQQIDAINALLKQGIEEQIDHQMSLRHLLGIVNAYGGS